MARTSSAAVVAVLGPDYDTGRAPSLTPYIDAAASMVEDLVECAGRREITLSETKLEIIERWLAAHFYTCSDPTYLEKQTQSARGKYMGTSGKGLDGSRYGQMAVSLDPSGCLKSRVTGQRAQLLWLGLPPSEQTDVQDRD